MHRDADGNWHADLDTAQDAPSSPDPVPAASLPGSAPMPAQASPALPNDPAAAGFALPAAAAAPPQPRPQGVRPGSRRGWRRALPAIGIAVVVILVKLFLLNGAARVISIATTATYHEPTAIAGEARSSDPTVTATVTQLENGIQLPSLQGGHTEGAGYTNTQSNLDYVFLLAQDNANNDSQRTGADLTSMFGGDSGTSLSAIDSSTFNGMNLDCATVTVTDASGTGTSNACDWYNANAFGLFVDNKSASLTATEQLATDVLTAMIK